MSLENSDIFISFQKIEVDTLSDSFPACLTAPVLAHELGHAFHIGASRRNETLGFVSEADSVFEMEDQRQDAIAISERMRGISQKMTKRPKTID